MGSHPELPSPPPQSPFPHFRGHSNARTQEDKWIVTTSWGLGPILLELVHLNKGQSCSILEFACLERSPSTCCVLQVWELETFVSCLNQNCPRDGQTSLDHHPTSPFSITKTLFQMWGKCQSPWLELGGLPATTGYNPTHICYAHFCTQGKVEHCSTSKVVHVTAQPRDELFSKDKMLCDHVIQSWAAVGKCVCS